MLHCRVCGRPGFDICPDCQFKEMNRQCWRCGMYIPAAEMQQYKGQWICPNCLMDMRAEDEKMLHEPKVREKLGECERCGRRTGILYRYRGRLLCEVCLKRDEDYMARGPSGGKVVVRPLKKEKKRGLLQKLVDFILGRKRKGPEIVEVVVAKEKEGAGKGKVDWTKFKDVRTGEETEGEE